MAAFSKLRVGDTLLIEVEVIDLAPSSPKRVQVRVKYDPASFGGPTGWLPDNVVRRARILGGPSG